MKVVYFGTYRADYSRNQILIAGLRSAGVEVSECHEALWHGIEDRVNAASGGWVNPAFIARFLRVYLRLLWRGLHLTPYDVLICGYPGHFDVFLARFLTWLRKRPLVWDVFMSIYLIALERGLDHKSGLTTGFIRLAEKFALRLPDRLVQDTSQYVTWLNTVHGVSPERFWLVPTGADDRTFKPSGTRKNPKSVVFTVLYYGTFIANHRVPYIIEAARILQEEAHLQFELVGEGPEKPQCEQLVQKYNLKNVTFVPWMSQNELVARIVQSDVCLGAFGKTPQSLMTVQNKIYEGLAMARPVVSGDSPAVRATLQHGSHIWLCDRDHPESLAQAILTLRAKPELSQQIAENGYTLFCARYAVKALGESLKAQLENMLKTWPN